MSDTLSDLKKMLEDAEKDVDGLKSAIRLLERRNSVPQRPAQEKENITPELDETGAINLDELELPAKPVKSSNTLSSKIRILIKRFGSQEFTVNHVDVALRKMGKGSDAKHFKNRVSIIIRGLTDEGVLERTYKGKGNTPHKYRQARQVSLVKNGSDEG